MIFSLLASSVAAAPAKCYVTVTAASTTVPTTTTSTTATSVPTQAVPKKVTILHTNDIHAHLDQFNKGGVDCTEKDLANNNCFGGFARIKTAVNQIRANNKDTILLDAGDYFQGTLFFNFFKGEPLVNMLNELGYDAFAMGNHEFDLGEEYLNTWLNKLKVPIISSNMDLSKSRMKDAPVKPYVIIPKYNLGIIGFITPTTGDITIDTKDITFSDAVSPVQKYVDELRAKGIKRIVALSHNGYFEDQAVAQKVSGLNAIIGGHSHSLLINNNTAAVGPYPTEVISKDGKKTYIVQAYRYGNYLGNIDLVWDDKDELVSVNGTPLLLDQSIPRDNATQAFVDKLRATFQPLVSETLTVATADFKQCTAGVECPLGNVITDCMLTESIGDFSWNNVGGIRAPWFAGNVTTASVLATLPFGNVVASYKSTGKEVFDVLVGVATGINLSTNKSIISPPVFGGLRYKKLSAAPYVSDITIGGKPLDLTKTYTVLTNDFTAGGGDNIIAPTKFVPGDVLADVVARCIKKKPTISPVTDGRVA
ncbi:Metallo-dependent phosphatase-like protein [Gorgonomyces haynaldii]|nr:Metallo-dependent phosphatase-like protein [Gorgonomyces haynaldii]